MPPGNRERPPSGSGPGDEFAAGTRHTVAPEDLKETIARAIAANNQRAVENADGNREYTASIAADPETPIERRFDDQNSASA